MIFEKYHFKGSYPPLWNGWHLSILLTARYEPLTAPYFFIACKAYSEQVGIKRQVGYLFSGDKYFL